METVKEPAASGSLKMDTASSFETFILVYQLTSQMTVILIITAVRTSNLTYSYRNNFSPHDFFW
jgi:hypothetical protein